MVLLRLLKPIAVAETVAEGLTAGECPIGGLFVGWRDGLFWMSAIFGFEFILHLTNLT